MTKKLKLGSIAIGGGSPISIQSMNTTEPKDVEGTVRQIELLTKAGCEVARVAVNDLEDAASLRKIIPRIKIPLVSDIQFDYKLAIAACENGTDALRINPGNIGAKYKVEEVVRACKSRNIPCRIGVNSGSVKKELLNKSSHITAEILAESCREEIEIFESLDFTDICISVKSSDVKTMVGANRIISRLYPYPLHLGLTEAGTNYRGSLKSAMAMAILLEEGIGDTIRVSLTEDPIMEVYAAKEILINLGLRKGLRIVSCPTCGRTKIDLMGLAKKVEKTLDGVNYDITVAVMGCPVNGPGEAREADYGIAGGRGEGVLFRKGKVIKRVKEERLFSELLDMIEEGENNEKCAGRFEESLRVSS